MLGCCVGHMSWRGRQAGQRGCIDNMPESLRHHNRVSRLDTIDDTAQIDIYNLIPVFNTVLTDISADCDSRIIEDIVQSARALNGSEPSPLFGHAGV